MNIKFRRMVATSGFQSVPEYLVKIGLPVFGGALLLSVVSHIFFRQIPILASVVFIIVCIAAIGLYPAARFSMKRRDIHANLHLFITYAGTISTMHISRGMLFRRIAQKRVFGAISDTCQKILYLSTGWKLGFAESCRRVGQRLPSQILADFFDRFAVVMDFGQDLEMFLTDEQEAVLGDYATEYKKSLETIKVLQELFISLAVGFSFLLAIGILAPLFIDISVILVMEFSLLGFILLDGTMLVLVLGFIPSDKVFHSLPERNKAQRRIQLWFWIATVACVATCVGLAFTELPFMIIMAIGSTFLLVPGILASSEEKNVLRRNRLFPVYLRTLGSAIDVKNGGVISALKSTQVHDFGILNSMSIKLHRRLRLGSDKFRSWYFFAVESGSNMIYHFSRIFAESVYLGGKAGKIGELIARNALELEFLRNQRLQLAQGLRGAFYGALLGLCAVLYVTFEISKELISIFRKPEGLEDELFSFIDSIVKTITVEEIQYVAIFIGVLLILHAAASACLMKIVEGGSMYSALTDFVLMVWLCAILSYFLPQLAGGFLPDISNVWSSTVDTAL